MNTQLGGSTTSATELKVLPKYLLIGDLAHLAAAALLMSYLLFFDAPVGLLIQFILTGTIIWVMLRGWTWVILSALLANILVREPQQGVGLIGWGSVFYAWLCLCLLAYVAGYRTWRRELRYWLGLGLQTLLHAQPDPPASSQAEIDTALARESIGSTPRVGALWQSTAMAVKRVAGLLVVVLISMIVFIQLPVSRSGVALWWDRSLMMELKLWPGPLAFVLAVVGLLLISVATWRGLSRSEAELYLRTLTMTHYFRDIRSILGRLKKLRR